MRRHLIIGGSGQLGSAFRRLLPDAVAPGHTELDVTSRSDLQQALDTIQPVAIINCAGFTDVDAAEGDPAAAFSVNSVGVGTAAAVADAAGIPLVSFSSDYVFDGLSDRPYLESSWPNPINAYGRSKLAGERQALRYRQTLIVRTAWLLSETHPNFVTAILSRAATGSLRVVSDQMGSPTFAEDVAAATLVALDRELAGILHLAGGPPTSWYGLAQAALAAAGADPGLATPCTTEEYPRQASRPRWSAMESERLNRVKMDPVPSWTQRLPQLVRANPQR